MNAAAEQPAILDVALDLWVEWMRNDWAELRQLGYPERSAGFSTGGAVSPHDSFEDLEHECDHRIALAVNAAVDSLPPGLKAAINHSTGLCAVFRLRDYEEKVAEARARIYRALLSAGVV